MKLKILCRLCGEKFTWYADEFPDECPLCHQYIGNDGKPEVAAPFIGLRHAKNGDGIYRAMERGAEHRIDVASNLLGVPRSELSDMKITNMGDNAREGEDTAPKVSPHINKLMEFQKTQEAQQTIPMEIASRAFNHQEAQAKVQEARQMTPEKMHPQSGVGTGLNTLSSLRESKYKMGRWG
jgi:hypothetical protein